MRGVEIDSAEPRATPQTDQFLLWGFFLLLLAAAFLLVVTLREERVRLAGLQKVESDRESELAEVEQARVRASRVVTRFNADEEFVRDQARERLGVAAPDEVVIRIESSPGAPSGGTRPSPGLFSPEPR